VSYGCWVGFSKERVKVRGVAGMASNDDDVGAERAVHCRQFFIRNGVTRAVDDSQFRDVVFRLLIQGSVNIDDLCFPTNCASADRRGSGVIFWAGEGET
jgi:hypothetical protein